MKQQERSDLLLSETVDAILDRFEVEHVFPTEFLKEEKDERGFWRRLRDSIAAFFGFGRRPVSVGDREPRTDDAVGGSTRAPIEASVGGRPSAQELAVRAKP
jgi:hypothetical protein